MYIDWITLRLKEERHYHLSVLRNPTKYYLINIYIFFYNHEAINRWILIKFDFLIKQVHIPALAFDNLMSGRIIRNEIKSNYEYSNILHKQLL